MSNFEWAISHMEHRKNDGVVPVFPAYGCPFRPCEPMSAHASLATIKLEKKTVNKRERCQVHTRTRVVALSVHRTYKVARCTVSNFTRVINPCSRLMYILLDLVT